MNKKDSLLLPSRYLIAAVCMVVFGVSSTYAFFGTAASSVNSSTAAVNFLDDCDDDRTGEDCDCDDDDDDRTTDDGDCDCEDRLFSNLTGPTINGQMPRGFAKFNRGDDDLDNDNRLKVYVRFVNLPEDTLLGVFVNDILVGNLRLSENGNAQKSFNINYNILEGAEIEIRDGGNEVLSGEFGCGDDGTPLPSGSATATPTRTPTGTQSGTPTASPTGTPGGPCNEVFAYRSSNNRLLRFNIGTPGSVLELQLTGLGQNERLLGIDFRPANGQLYAIATNGSTYRVVTISTTTGAVTNVGPDLANAPGTRYGFDFNPVPDRIRAVNDEDVSIRLNPNDGTLSGVDSSLAYAPGDINFGANPNVVHVAYDNNVAGASSTTLYGIDTNLDVLVRIGGVSGNPSPNGGQLTTIGPLGVNAGSSGGLDIQQGTGAAYAALTVGGDARFYFINLATGTATRINTIGAGFDSIDGLALSNAGCSNGNPGCFTVTTLSGAQEVPPTNSQGAGVGTISLSPDQTRLSVTLSFSGLTSNAVAAHIHGPAPAGVNAPVIFGLSGVPSATSGSIPPQSFAITPAQVAQFRAGLFYFNLHTVNFPNGEIRGQVNPPAGCGGSTPSGTPTFTPTGTPTATPTGSPTPGQARLFTAKLKGQNIVPPVGTDARGFAAVILNSSQTQIQAVAGFVNLSSNQINASINCPAVPGQNGPAIANLGSVGGTSGFVNGTFNVTALQAATMQAGLCYFVIGSQNFPSGEIRGQLMNQYSRGDFDGDGKADVSVFRPSNGTWYHLNSSDGRFAAGQFGMAGDRPIAGDFDGDGKGEFAVFRSVNGSGIWYIQNSSDNSFVARQWGLGSDIPMAGDFDGDGRSDLAVFRASEGNWYVSQSSNGAFSAKHWGQAGDIPLSADYDGDGTADLVVFRPSNGTFYILRSSDGGYSGVQWGLSSDKPVTGDFDGDGLADIAVFRPSEGNWYVNGSRGAIIALHFGINGDIPVPGRFDDDEKTDIAVFRPSEGTWYFLKSQTNAMTATNFGLSGDVPISGF